MTVPRPDLVDDPGIAVRENTPRPADSFTRIGYEHLDRLITYPYPRNLSASAQPIRMSERRPGINHFPTSRGVEQTSRRVGDEVTGAQRAASITAFAVFRPTPVRSR